jgi:NAD dependent epimerase/dehydratase family enzyme
VPRFLIEGVLGQMGREMLLSSCRVRPGRLNATGFTFEQPNLRPALEELLAH